MVHNWFTTGSHFTLRGGVFYLRLRLPAHIARTLRRTHLWFSLRTSDRREAEFRAKSAAFKLRRFFRTAAEQISETLFRELVESIKKDIDDWKLLSIMPELLTYEAEWHLNRPKKPRETETMTPAPTPQVPPPIVPPVPPSSSLKEAADDYWKENFPSWKARTVSEYEIYRKRLLEFVGKNSPLNTIDHATMKKFKDSLIESGLSASRVNGHLTFAGAVFRFARRHKMMTVDNPVEGVKLKRKGRDGDKEVFTPEDLKAIFSSPRYLANEHKPHRKWIPLIGLFTGARLEELAQLYREDVKEVDGLWCIDINESRPDQSLKTKASARVVPLHPLLIERGFIRYVKGLPLDSRVFPGLRRIKDRYSHKESDAFKNVLKSAGVVGKKSFHSFRHTVMNYLSLKDIPVQTIRDLVGHDQQGTAERFYIKRLRPKDLMEKMVLKLDFEI